MATGDDWGNVTICSDKGDGDHLFWEVVQAPKGAEKPGSFLSPALNEDDELKSGVPFSLPVYAGTTFKETRNDRTGPLSFPLRRRDEVGWVFHQQGEVYK